MDYLGWELERQRAALWALLGGGEPEEGEASGEKSPGWEDKAPGDGTRRSSESPEKARRRDAGRTGRYAAGGGEAGGPLMGAPGAWEMVRAADWTALEGESDGPEPPESGALQRGEAGSPARGMRNAETGVPAVPRRKPAEEVWGTSRIGTGGAAEPRTSSGGRGDGRADWETVEEIAAEAKQAAGTAGERRAGEDPAGGDPSMEAGGAPHLWDRPDGGESARGASAVIREEGAGRVPFTRDGLTGAADRQGRMFRALPWSGRESAVLQAEGGAKALSRAVQRDARRYDGGFTIY